MMVNSLSRRVEVPANNKNEYKVMMGLRSYLLPHAALMYDGSTIYSDGEAVLLSVRDNKYR